MREIGKHPTNAEDSPLTRLQIICPQVLLGIGLRNPDLDKWKKKVLMNYIFKHVKIYDKSS